MISLAASYPLDNLVAWFVQVLILVGAGAVFTLALRHPRARLWFWHAVLLAAILLPLFEPRVNVPQPAPAPVKSAVSRTLPSAPVAVPVPGFSFEWRSEYLIWLLVTGAALRLGWISAGLLRLRIYRRDAERLHPAPLPFEGAHIRWYISDRVAGPVTFGWLRPAVLLPPNFREFAPDVQEAIASHEMMHVLRHDWLYVLAGEIVRAALWFHPAVWFALGQVQLAREQVVDLEVVRFTRNRRSYLDALVTVAARNLQPDVAPAPLFLKKRQLAVRVAAVLKESSMSMPRIAASLVAVGLAAVATTTFAVWFFPMHAQAQSINVIGAAPADGSGVVVDPGGKLLHRTSVYHPRGVQTTGNVIIELTLDAKGEVADARVLSGPDELRKAALESVLGWHYSPDMGAGARVRVSMQFNAAPPVPARQPTKGNAPASGIDKGFPIEDILFEGLTPELERQITQHLPVHRGDMYTLDSSRRINSAIRDVDEHLVMGLTRGPSGVTLRFSFAQALVRGGVPGGVVGGVSGGVVGGVPGNELRVEMPPPPPPPAPLADGTQRVRVGANVQQSNLVRRVIPAYPPLAKQARISGVVRFNAIIGTDGSVRDLQLISGHPLLVQAANSAVAQWLYKPTLLNGAPVEVITQIDVNFTLSEDPLQIQ